MDGRRLVKHEPSRIERLALFDWKPKRGRPQTRSAQVNCS
jgi:hypothetical protein